MRACTRMSDSMADLPEEHEKKNNWYMNSWVRYKMCYLVVVAIRPNY